jgi:molybdenum cofactor cytidylyltransferase
MGGPNKLLLPYRGRPLVSWAAEAACASRAECVVIVTGRDGDEVESAVPAHAKLLRTHNAAPEQGLSSSLRCGLAETGGFDAVAVLLGDMPDIQAPLIDALLLAHRRGIYAVRPYCRDEPGHPVVLGPRAVADCLRLSGDRGAGALFDADAQSCVRIDLADAAIRFDLDEPDQFGA